MSGSLIPEEFAKLVFSIPSSFALDVIKIANSSSVPAIPSANVTHASFPEATIIPLNKSSTETSSFTIINIEEYPEVDKRHAFSETINLSSKLMSPDLIKSNAIIAVIILVIEAGYIEISASFSYKISPEKKSCKIAVLALV